MYRLCYNINMDENNIQTKRRDNEEQASIRSPKQRQ